MDGMRETETFPRREFQCLTGRFYHEEPSCLRQQMMLEIIKVKQEKHRSLVYESSQLPQGAADAEGCVYTGGAKSQAKSHLFCGCV